MKKIIVAAAIWMVLLGFSSVFAVEAKIKIPDLQISIPGLNFTEAGSGDKITINWIAEYIAALYKYAIGIVGILAAVVMMFGGLQWLTAGGNTGQTQSAKEWIKAALTGLIIALTSYIILFTINPDLITFKSIGLKSVTTSTITKESTSNALQNIPPDSPVGSNKLTESQARTQLVSSIPDIELKNGVILNGINKWTIDGFSRFYASCQSKNENCSPPVITSGVSDYEGHTVGAFSHYNGYKLDLRDNSIAFNGFIRNFGYYGGVIDGNPVYYLQDIDYQYRLIDEGDHWDFRIVTHPERNARLSPNDSQVGNLLP